MILTHRAGTGPSATSSPMRQAGVHDPWTR